MITISHPEKKSLSQEGRCHPKRSTYMFSRKVSPESAQPGQDTEVVQASTRNGEDRRKHLKKYISCLTLQAHLEGLDSCIGSHVDYSMRGGTQLNQGLVDCGKEKTKLSRSGCLWHRLIHSLGESKEEPSNQWNGSATGRFCVSYT